MGDFNYDPVIHKNEEILINSERYKDSWLEYLKIIGNFNLDGHTYPEEDNIQPTRLDRIYYDSNGIFNKLKYFEIIGKDKIEVNKNQIRNSLVDTPSDHFGIFAEFEINK